MTHKKPLTKKPSPLTRAFKDPERQAMAIAALSNLRAGYHSPSLGTALEACVGVSEQPGAMEAVHHVVSDIYKRGELITQLGSDASKWQNFLAENRPRYEYFNAARQWYEENKGKTRIADEGIQENRARAEEVHPTLVSWLENNSMPIPLGLSRGEVERLQHDINKFKRNLIHSDINR